MDIKSMKDIDINALVSISNYSPSPKAWEDQVFYFLLLDRFSDGKESGYIDNSGNMVVGNGTQLFSSNQAYNTPYDSWLSHAQGWKGGNLKGLTSKLGYLKRMGITAIWMSPFCQQVAFEETYHGYGIQNFLKVDPHFGTNQDLIDLVKTAHSMGMYVILDIILNHTGNVFAYDPDRFITQDNNGNTYLEPRWDGKQYKVKGYRNASGDPVLQFKADAAANTNEAIFPSELQEPSSFTQKGIIKNWDYYPEYCEGDFLDLKDLNHGSGPVDNYSISKTLETLANIYKFWITLTDCDGFRIDTVKHMDKGATRYFASVIHEFGQTIGKEKFLLIGEITGGRENAFDTLEATGLDAALGIDDIPDKMEYLVKGYREPVWYFDLFRNSILVNKDSHAWFRNKVVTMFDDHDGVSDGKWKARFCAKERGDKVVLNALALNALSLGIPCIYYGSEQYFNGHATEERDGNDIFLRESMFGGKFGSFQSSGYHFFDESSPAYAEFAKILKLRSQQIALRRGRQYLREISGDGMGFGLPHMMGTEIRSVVPWSRIIDQQEIVVAINTDYDNARTAWVTVDSGINEIGKNFTCLYSTDCAMINYQVPVEAKNGRAIKLTVPAAGCVIYK